MSSFDSPPSDYIASGDVDGRCSLRMTSTAPGRGVACPVWHVIVVMPKTRAQKMQEVATITDRLREAAGVVLLDFTGVKINELEELRAKGRAAGCAYLVVKKSLFGRAITESGIPIDVPGITGSLSMLTSASDPIAPARIAKGFGKDHAAMRVVGGVLRSGTHIEYMDAARVAALGDLPGRDELLQRLVGSMVAPLRGFAGVLHGTLRGFVGVLHAIAQAKA